MQKRKVKIYCPLCEHEHEVDYVEEMKTCEFKGEEITVESHYYYCPKHPEEPEGFVNGKMMDENLLRVRNEYRAKKNLLTSDDIVSIRKKYQLSQVDLSKLLGWGGATISRYETKQIQDETHDSLLKQVRDNPMFTYRSLLRHKKDFSQERLGEIKELLIDELDRNGYLENELLESYYVEYSEPSEYNGNTTLNVGKLIACISYIASKMVVYKTQLMKLLWYCDMQNYKSNHHSITGLVYTHQNFGALPLGTIIELKGVKSKVEYSFDDNEDLVERYRIYPNNTVDYSLLNDNELATIDRVIDKFKDYNTKAIVDYMHKEKAYINTALSEVIPYSYAEELNEF